MKPPAVQLLKDTVAVGVAAHFGPMAVVAVKAGQEIRDGLVFPMRWRVRTRLPERFGMPCRLLVRGGRNSGLVEFVDGFRVVTSRNYIRKAVL